MHQENNACWQIATGDYRFVLLGELRRLMAEARQEAERAATPDFVSREKAELVIRRSVADAVRSLAAYGAQIVVAFPGLEARVAMANDLAGRIRTAETSVELIDVTSDITSAFALPAHPPSAPPVRLVAMDGGVVVEIGSGEPASEMAVGSSETATAIENVRQAQLYLAAISAQIAAVRNERRELSGVEQIARAAAYQALEAGITVPAAFRPIGTSGFRRWQTSLSLADPGEGHNLVTCLDARVLDGTVVHVEHIDRGVQTNREIVEAYRLPAPLSAARVRLQAGIAAPCTAYIGRPAFENGAAPHPATYMPMARYFDDDLLKAAHMTASACTVMFANGIADCKIAIERMSAQQAIGFMAAVAGNVSRDASRQFLSAAFNINQPLLDDRDPATLRWTGSRIDTAQLGIELAQSGGFDKVTWDGASNLPKSEPIIAAFTSSQWLALIHNAHERGLETYVSAGMDRTHMAACVESGVDGVGIGTSLHYLQRTAEGKIVMGELNPEAVLDVLQVRDVAASSVKGRAATALAMLDRLSFERLLPAACEDLRAGLFTLLTQTVVDEGTVTIALEQLGSEPFWQAIEAHKSASYDKHPAIAQAERRLLAAEFADPTSFAGVAGGDVNARLRAALARGDITEIMEELR